MFSLYPVLLLVSLVSICQSFWVIPSSNRYPDAPYIFSPFASVSLPSSEPHVTMGRQAPGHIRSSGQFGGTNAAGGEEEEGFAARFLKPLFTFTKKQSKTSKERYLEICARLNGTVVDNECYQYIPEALTFNVAEAYCMERGGGIWTPDFNDIFLFDKIRIAIPYFTAAPDNAVWTGARIHSGRITDVNRNDVTHKQFFQIENDDPNTMDGCALYDFATGAQTFSIDFCDDAPYHFICEYDIYPIVADAEEESKPTLVFKKGPFLFFDHFAFPKQNF